MGLLMTQALVLLDIVSGWSWADMTDAWWLRTEDWGLMTEASTSWLIQSLLQGGEFSDRFMSEKGIIKKLSQMLLEKFVKTWQFDDSWTLNGESCADLGSHISHNRSISGNICQFCWFFSSIDAELFGLASVLRQRRLKSKCLSLTSDPVSFVSTGNEFVFFTFCSLKNKKFTSCPKSTQVPKYKQN